MLKESVSGVFVDGVWERTEDRDVIEVENPATGELLARVTTSTKEEVDRAVGTAHRCFRGNWKHTQPSTRASLLRNIARLIRAAESDLAMLETEDVGKPLAEATLDIQTAADIFDYFAGEADRLELRQSRPVATREAGHAARLRWEPIGVAALILPWNFPFLLASAKLAAALAAGCTAVVKPSEVTPLTTLRLAEIGQAAGLPDGVLSVLTGTGSAVGVPLCSHPLVGKISFTGSTETGTLVLQSAAPQIKRVSLELGGKSPVLVFEDVDIQEAAELVAIGIFMNQGEVCSASSRLLVADKVADPLLEQLKLRAESLRIGDGRDPSVSMGPLVSQRQLHKVRNAVRTALEDGASLLTGGGRPTGLEQGHFIEPTILCDVPEDSMVWEEEIFGPVLCVRRFSAEDEAIASANRSRFGLAATVLSKDLDRCHRVADQLEAGMVWVNCSQPYPLDLPWGGVKQSGLGREMGRWGLEAFLEIKHVLTKS